MSSSSDEEAFPEGIYSSTETIENLYPNLSDSTVFDPNYPSLQVSLPKQKDKKNVNTGTTEINGEKPPEEEIDTSKLEIRFVDQT